MDRENTVFRSLEIIESRIAEKLTVENIADSVYFSKYHYQRLFREIVGGSVMEYVTKRKLTLAGRELLETNGAILDIALQFGYDSHEGFTRSFKAYMGVTPTEYRKYGLAAISQKSVKERADMTASKSTDEIIRELNDFIAKARETAEYARKSGVREYTPFWDTIARKTDALADRLKAVLERITAIAAYPDEISKRFVIIKAIEDIAFETNLLAFNAGLMVSRGQPEHIRIQKPLCDRYNELARASGLKAGKAARLLGELSSCIFADMRKTAADKLREVIEKGRAAEESIVGYSYYIKHEIAVIVNELSETPYEDVTVSRLEDYLFKLDIIALAADADIFRSPEDGAMFDGLAIFKESLSEAVEFFQTLVRPESGPASESAARKRFTDIAFQGNIFLFYIRGEVEKLGGLLDDGQKAAFGAICGRIDEFIQFALRAGEETDRETIAGKLYDIHSGMAAEAEKLAARGGAILFLAGQVKLLAESAAGAPAE
ncbi:hypothetical protein FACS1894191_2730 [Clostridia bacterium]|nr:hypothetical protein FACS1894191_2730 [Clostridia bacterium]